MTATTRANYISQKYIIVAICVVLLIGIPGYYIITSNHFSSSMQQIVNVMMMTNRTNPRDDVNMKENKSVAFDTNETKVIMFWTTWYSNKMWFKLPKSALGRSLFKPKYCKHTNCILTNDHSRLKEADVLLFYGPPSWPKIRYPHQYYAHFMHEAPGRRHSGTLLGVYNGKINLTINFRHDADVHVPYNTFVARDKPITYKPRFPLANKTKMAVWPVSHCKTLSQREDYVKELSKYIEVDIFGGCGKYKCPRGSSHTCLEKWERSYKFFLSFENIFCDDYITEKLFKTLEHEIIPVVLGGGNYTRDAPPHSVINILDFSSPKALADYLIELGKDEERYYSYFRWKSGYEMAEIYSVMMCR